jgi:orotate phosphoribosyltransferase
MSDRDREIYLRLLKGETQQTLAGEFKLSRGRINDIFVEVDFATNNPKLASILSDRERPLAAFLWSRGYSIIPPKHKR